jgi:hypothetical protein
MQTSRPFLAAIALSVSFSACATARMQVDPGLAAGAEAMVVTGNNPRVWNRPLAFGPYHTVQVSEGGEWSWAIPLIIADIASSRQSYRVSVSDGERSSDIACTRRRTSVDRDGLSIDVSRVPHLQCAIRADGDSTAWVLRLRERGTRFDGALESGGTSRDFRVVSAHRLEGGAFDSGDPVGFTVERDGRTVSAVETINRGRVWVDPSLAVSERMLAASVATALLLFDTGNR